jgi:DNA polymerase-3 subunit chi
VTKASFYILGETTREARVGFAVKFVRQSWRKGLDVYCHVRDATDAAHLDHALWADTESFIPHAIESETPSVPRTPIAGTVGIGWTDPQARHGLFVNLADALPDWFTHFDDVVEIVTQDPETLAATRDNWKRLKFNGYPITQHDLRS